MQDDELLLKEKDFEDYEKIHSSPYTVVDKRIFPLTPLAKIIASERKYTSRKRMKEVNKILSRKLNPTEHALFVSLFGVRWHENYSLPGLDFIDGSNYITRIISDVKERLTILREAIPNLRNVRKEGLYLGLLPYFLTTEKETIAIYQNVISGKGTFPRDFFRFDKGRKAGIVTRFLYEMVKGYSPEDTFTMAKKKDFKENYLGHMLEVEFNDIVLDAIRNAYPKEKFPFLYKTGDPGKGLGHIVSSLDSLFDQ